jgi:intracellular septation protein A
MKYLLGLLTVFILGDGFLTHILVGDGMREGNSLLVPLITQGNLMLLKLVGTIVCVIILWDLYRKVPKVALISTSCLVVAYGAIVLWNFSLLLSLGVLLPSWLGESPLGELPDFR